ncbi:hypothetical protein Cpir12675_006965 [Ceratocystis pirilliformis]|uniref:Uncharacterized protein n=1 Tax=Ceratocystis pirilliformis TaxID=259994 RepID=A0ABR3YDW4_9PEZI
METQHDTNTSGNEMDLGIDGQKGDASTVEDIQLEELIEDVDTGRTHERIPEQEPEITSGDNPDKVQERTNERLNDLYLKDILKRPYIEIQNGQEDDENPTAKRIRAMMAKITEREPGTYEEALNHPIHASKWQQAIDTELKTLREFNTWTSIPFEKGMKLVITKFVLKIKPSSDNQPEKFKASLLRTPVLSTTSTNMSQGLTNFPNAAAPQATPAPEPDLAVKDLWNAFREIHLQMEAREVEHKKKLEQMHISFAALQETMHGNTRPAADVLLTPPRSNAIDPGSRAPAFSLGKGRIIEHGENQCG